MTARARMEFLFWFASYTDDFLQEIVELIRSANISARRLEPFVVDKCFAPELLGRRKFKLLISTLGRLNALEQLDEDKLLKQLLILFIQIPAETERASWFALLQSANASELKNALSGNYLDDVLKYVNLLEKS